jgi:YfiH family protein
MIPQFFSAQILQKKGIFHGFFTKNREKNGKIQLCNVAFDRGDADEIVIENQEYITEIAKAKKIFFTKQEHTNKVLIVDETIDKNTMTICDALVTRSLGVLLGIYTADCVPMLLCDPVNKVIGVAHCGWKGLKTQVIRETLREMCSLGASQKNVLAAIGPCIHQRNYQVDEQFLNNFPSYEDCFIKKEEKWFADLPKIAKKQLQEQGVQTVEDLEKDTYELQNLFFSYRRFSANNTGLPRAQASVIMLTSN